MSILKTPQLVSKITILLNIFSFHSYNAEPSARMSAPVVLPSDDGENSTRWTDYVIANDYGSFAADVGHTKKTVLDKFSPALFRVESANV